MKKILFYLTTLMVSATSVYAALPQSLKEVLPSCAEFVAQNSYPTKATDLEAWLIDSSTYFQEKLPYYDTLSYEPLQLQLNRNHGWAHLNEQYYFALFRLAADSVMNAPFISVSWNDGGPYDPQYVNKTRNTTNFEIMNELETVCEEMKEENTKTGRVRPRPYKYFPNQYYNGYLQTQDINSSGSYPSGHGYYRGLFGKCLEIIDPDNIDAINDMLNEWLHCRLLKGAHWASDLSAGEKLGRMAFESAMNVEYFRNLVFAARQELEEYRGITVPTVREGEEQIETYLTSILNSTTNLTINRTLYKDGNFNTLCLPFSLTADEIATGPLAGCELFEFEGATMNGDKLELHIAPVSAIVAGQPYLIRWTTPGENISSMTFNGVTIAASAGQSVGTEGVQFVGTMGQSEMEAGNENLLFLGANNTLYWPNADKKLKGFRAYFLVSGSVAPHNAPARLVVRNSPTGLQDVPGDKGQWTKELRDGQLLIIRDGVRYNVQGQVVK